MMAIQDDASLSTSATLLQRALAHEPEAWRQLCQLYAPLVYAWIRKGGVSSNDAPDLVQDVFRIVAQHLSRFRSDRPGDTFRGWLITITQTEVRSYFRRRSRQTAGEGGTTATYRLHQVPDAVTLESEDSARSDSELQDHPQYDRQQVMRRAAELIKNDYAPHVWQAFWRSVVENESPDVIAADLQMTNNAIRQARFRVLNRLRKMLANSELFDM